MAWIETEMDEENVSIINEQLRIPMAELRFRFSGSSGPGGVISVQCAVISVQ